MLVDAGHRVITWAPEEARPVVESAGARLRPFGVLSGPPDTMDPNVVAVRLAEQAARDTGRLAGELHDERVDVLVHDSMAAVARVAGRWLGLPRACSCALFPPGPLRRRRRPRRRHSVAPELVAAYRRSWEEVARTWGIELGDLDDLLLNEGGVNVSYTTPEIAGFGPRDPSWRMVGPLLAPAPGAGAGAGRPLVYVAFGTHHSHRPERFSAVLEALAAEDVRVLVSTGGRLDPGALAPWPANAEVVLHVDSRAVLAGAALHVTHGGAGSVHESLAAGVPMVVLPIVREHERWAARVAALGAGRVVSPRPRAVRRAAMALLGDERAAAAAREAARGLERHGGESAALAAVESLVA